MHLDPEIREALERVDLGLLSAREITMIYLLAELLTYGFSEELQNALYGDRRIR